MSKEYDFSGIVTAYEVPCQDGRVIKDGCFNHQAGEHIPMLWRHGHSDPTNIIGLGRLSVNENPAGMRVHARFNSSQEGQRAKMLVHNGSVDRLSIWANELSQRRVERALEVSGGIIREFSLVMLGANPGASIDEVIVHSDDPYDPDAVVQDGVLIHSGFAIEIGKDLEEDEDIVDSVVEQDDEITKDVDDSKETEEDEVEIVEKINKEITDLVNQIHDLSEDIDDVTEDVVTHAVDLSEVINDNSIPEKVGDLTIMDIVESLTSPQRNLFNVILHSAASGDRKNPLGEDSEDWGTYREVFETLSKEQQNVLFYMTGEMVSSDHLSQEQEEHMSTHNIFEDGNEDVPAGTIADTRAVNEVLERALRGRVTSLRDTFKAAGLEEDMTALQHSITTVENMFPDAINVQPGGPQFYTRPTEWVETVLQACRTRPFSRIKSMYADLTAADARAKGYTTGNQKAEQVLPVLKRVTTPQTLYKFQKLDRDDMIDIVDFDVVSWLKTEMRLMMREELARAILITDGRANTGDDAIMTTNVRPIYNDDAVYTINMIYNDVSNEQDLVDFTAAEVVALVDYIAAARSEYRGKGSPVFYCQPEVLTKLLLVRDAENRRLHSSVADLAEALRVKDIVEIPPMSGMEATGQVDPTGLPAGTYDIATLGVIVNLGDYIIGADKGGQMTFFEDFDLNYNKHEYLYETRLSGALVTPKSAITIQLVTAKTA